MAALIIGMMICENNLIDWFVFRAYRFVNESFEGNIFK